MNVSFSTSVDSLMMYKQNAANLKVAVEINEGSSKFKCTANCLNVYCVGKLFIL